MVKMLQGGGGGGNHGNKLGRVPSSHGINSQGGGGYHSKNSQGGVTIVTSLRGLLW